MTQLEEAETLLRGAKFCHYQKELYEFLLNLKTLDIVVETGYGVSTKVILAALAKRGSGRLYTIDPKASNPDVLSMDYDCPKITEVESSFWKPLAKKSIEVLTQIPLPWDVFLHDSDHDVFCQTMEFEIAWRSVVPGGWILCDDSTWGSTEFQLSRPHHAWKRFLEARGLTPSAIKFCAFIQKPLSVESLSTTFHDLEVIKEFAHQRYLEYKRKVGR